MLTLPSFAFLLLAPRATLTPERISLDGAWRLTQSERKIDIPARVPGVVQLDLMRAKLIPDPYQRMNEKAVQWVGETRWTYSRPFLVPASFLRYRHLVLRCEGLDTLATLRVNGQIVAHPDNMHRTWEFDMRPYLHAGANSMAVDFEPIEPFLKAHETQAKFPGKPVQSHGWGYVRKASFQMGWDFSPKLVTSGIWRPISLLGWDGARITSMQIVQHHSANRVGLDVGVSATTEGRTTTRVSVWFKGRKIGSGVSGHVDIRNPQLWWPNGMGAQNLYEVRAEVFDSQGNLLDRSARRIGLRTITWYPKTATSPLTLAVNGRRFFARGSNWVPPDSLLVRTTPAQIRGLVQKAVDAHMNLMRLWGGGFYEPDALFDAADEKGLLLWFEFKFADAAYPAFDPDWLANVRAEAFDNVQRVRHHPCVAVYSGNNEVIGFISEKTTPSSMSRADYNLLFHETLRDVVHQAAPGAFYTPGSPEIGDDHYWDVWHGSANFKSYRTRHGFMSEYGFQAFPVPRSVSSFASAEDRASVETPVMLNHQRNWRDGDALIVSTTRRYFRKPKDFDSTLWLSQINQADGILTGVEHWRRDWPHSSASLVWQFNDPWPVTSWSMVDYYGRPKALYYALKRAYAPVALSGIADAGVVQIWVANDRPRQLEGTVRWTLTRVDGKPLSHGATTARAAAGTSSTEIGTVVVDEYLKREGANNVLLWMTLSVPGEPDSRALVTFDTFKNLDLVAPEIHASVTKERDGYRVSLSAEHPALWTWVDLADADYSANFLHLQPGQTESIFVKPARRMSLQEVRNALCVRSLFDTYAPGTEALAVVRPSANGSIVAAADSAEIAGDAAILEPGPPANIGNWVHVEDSLRWSVSIPKPGRYTVTAIVAVPDSEAGAGFDVSLGASHVTGTVPPTGGWFTYKTISLGVLEATKAGVQTLTLTPSSRPHDHVMNLRSVTLTP